ncbi:hypothetical protein GXW82_11810 [Streptacidiphilus sp. 4-A2]|nr:hypothetical protein [Streptacidiphilus sp. 4-A2]
MRNPRIKTPHRPHVRPDGALCIGSLHYGLATELLDESGLVRSLCELMDGTRGQPEITATVAVRHGTTEQEVEEVFAFLVASGWVEDAGADLPVGLSAREEERYSRSTQFLSWIDTTPRTSPLDLQSRLKAAVVTVLGVGGIGSAVASSLVASGVGQVRCVDHDVVELANLNRQFLFNEDDLGRPKTAVAVDRLYRLNRDVQVTGGPGHQSRRSDRLRAPVAECADPRPADVGGPAVRLLHAHRHVLRPPGVPRLQEPLRGCLGIHPVRSWDALGPGGRTTAPGRPHAHAATARTPTGEAVRRRDAAGIARHTGRLRLCHRPDPGLPLRRLRPCPRRRGRLRERSADPRRSPGHRGRGNPAGALPVAAPGQARTEAPPGRRPPPACLRPGPQ